MSDFEHNVKSLWKYSTHTKILTASKRRVTILVSYCGCMPQQPRQINLFLLSYFQLLS